MANKRGFYDPDYLIKKMNSEVSLEGLASKGNSGSDNGTLNADDIIHFLIRNSKNYKVAKGKPKIEAKDYLRNDELGEILRNYKPLLDFATEELRKRKERKHNRYLLTKIKCSVLNDMTDSKGILDGVFGYDACPSESTVYDLSFIDLRNPAHIEALIPLKVEFDPNRDLCLILLDLGTIMEKCLNDEEKLMVAMIRDEFQIKEIAAELGITYKQTQYRLQKIYKKVAGI
ncbi:hypothetical protein NDK43_06760 [Neobacillus pocheonensis]|uniref:Sigma-70 family RNA polymerase sigma factor n=1 Tax=Neobacillus pocheonensis TaxID=363869 RepID=A0ABT0W764_9BACI|nr:hypothetical protein [Neobacillus pocheonensis]